MRMAIIGYSQTKFEYDVEMTREEMVFKTAKDAIESAGLTREDIGTV
ncbi:MAG TPA: thiolase domain-containing protein, partial [Archaeoglobus sp.]|nr:thiolase domain-containing protein [Archaeoglobus sp.]